MTLREVIERKAYELASRGLFVRDDFGKANALSISAIESAVRAWMEARINTVPIGHMSHHTYGPYGRALADVRRALGLEPTP